MPEEITLSIIIPNYNSGNLLKESLESIFRINVSISFEVLIMDNCSSDHPKKIINNFSYDNLYFYAESDAGIYDAMNKGILKAKGEWVYFLGSGDIFKFNEVGKIDFKFFECEDVKLLYGNVFMVNKNIIYDGVFSLSKLLKKNICHQSIIYNKVIFKNFGFYNNEFHIAADYELNLKIFFSKECKKSFLDVIIANYRGSGVSDLRKDRKFSNLKNNLIINFFFNNINFYSLITVVNYFCWLSKKKIQFEFSNSYNN